MLVFMKPCNFRTAQCMVVCAHKQNFLVTLLHAHIYSDDNPKRQRTVYLYGMVWYGIPLQFLAHSTRYMMRMMNCTCWARNKRDRRMRVSFSLQAVGWWVYTLCARVCFVWCTGDAICMCVRTLFVVKRVSYTVWNNDSKFVFTFICTHTHTNVTNRAKFIIFLFQRRQQNQKQIRA